MKKKLTKIMGVGLTVAMLASLVVVTAPAAADPGANYWSSFSLPGEGYLKGWKLANDTSGTPGLGPIAKAIDGDLFMYSNADGVKAKSDHAILKSTKGGYSWSELTTGVVATDPGAAIVDFACSPTDADVVYYATSTKVMKSTDGGSTWAPLSMVFGTSGTLDGITSIDCAEIGGSYVVVAGSSTDNDAFLYDESKLVPSWDPLNTPNFGTDTVLAVALSPNYAEVTNRVYIAVTVDATANTTNILTKVGGSVWATTVATATITSLEATSADIAFPDDYNYLTGNILYVGLDCTGGVGTGDVYQIIGGDTTAGSTARDMATGINVASVAVSGPIAATYILAGKAVDSIIFYSADSGENWMTTGTGIKKQPTGANDTYMLMSDDFADSGEAWAVCGGANGAVSRTADYGISWNQIGAINYSIDGVNDLSVVDDTVFVATDSPGDCIEMDCSTTGTVTVTITAGAVKLTPNLSTLATVSVAGSVATITFLSTYGDVFVTATEDGTTATYAAGTGTSTNTLYRDDDPTDDASVTGNTAFVLPDASGYDGIWRYASDWERIYSSLNAHDLVEASPDYADTSAVFVANVGGTSILRSINGGNILTVQPTAVGGSTSPKAIAGWVIVDSTTVITGMEKNVCRTTNNGLSWVSPEAPSLTSGNYLNNFCIGGDSIICASSKGFFYYSKDRGVTWTGTGSTHPISLLSATGQAYPAFDGGEPYYMAVDDDTYGGIYRYSAYAWTRIDAAGVGSDNITNAKGIALGSDGTLYVTDSTDNFLMSRCLNPTDSVLATSMSKPFFETVTASKTATLTKKSFSRLWITEGSNKLWALSTSIPTTGSRSYLPSAIYAYEDEMAVPVTGLTATADPSDRSKATVSWDAMDSATGYYLEQATTEDFLANLLSATPTLATADRTGLSAGKTYYYRVRAKLPVRSLFSDVVSFTTGMAAADISADFGAPRPGATDVPTDAVFTWQEVPGAVSYQFQITEDLTFYDTPTLLLEDATVTTNTYVIQGLAYSTIYYWRVKAIGAVTESDWANGVFTTKARPEEAAEAVVIVEPGEPGEVTIVEVPVPGPAQAIPSYLLWTVIVIGAVLIIALIILIVRTRRVA